MAHANLNAGGIMMGRIQRYSGAIKSFLLIAAVTVLVLGYNNCAPSSEVKIGSKTGSSTKGNGTCDEALFNQYKTDVYPFFRAASRCVSCHIEGGPGLGVFASEDTSASFAAFSAAGLSKVSYMATNAQHKPPYTGPQNKAAMDELSVKWNQYTKEHLDCVSRSENGGQNDSLLTSEKSAPTIYATRGAKETLTWELDFAGDLDESANRSLPARISIDVSVFYQNNRAIGYVFSNPVMQLKDVTKQVVIEGLFFQINKQPISSQTTFTNLSRVVGGSNAMALMPNTSANTIIEPISTQDTFQLYVRRITLASGAEDSPAPLTPMLTVTDSETGSNLLLKSRNASVRILRDAGITRWCLSESSTKPASTEAPCQSGMTGNGIVNGWSLSRPTTFMYSQNDGLKQLYLWVANQNLKINDQPALVAITLDTAAPAAPTIASINVSDTQVGDLSLTHPNEADVAGWCVLEYNSATAAPGAPNLGNRCWSWTDNGAKPTTVGFKSGGARSVRVYVRDKAGNISAASATSAATNPHGAITFSQLTSAAGGPRAIFYNRCHTCHGTAQNPGFSRLQLFSFTAASDVADSGVLVSRINNPLSPMPNVNGGLMPQRERDLIRLWTMPEEGNEPLP